MLYTLWLFLMPVMIAVCFASVAAEFFPKSGPASRTIQMAREVLMTERELAASKENPAARVIIKMIVGVQKYFDLEELIFRELRNILRVTGSGRSVEKEVAGYVLNGLAGALPLIIVPYLTGFNGYFAFYPAGAAALIVQQYRKRRKNYGRWQRELVKNLPELIDKLQISFASGRDYLSAFVQTRENSGYAMRVIIDCLVNDFQTMHPGQALDIFAETINIPVVTKFVSAVKISIDHGYEAAKSYFALIENEVAEIRRVAVEELTKAKPEKVYQLYFLLMALAVGSLLIKGWEIFSQINKIM